ncbi:YggS family pyridoxal phosphate-dependent enzyme [Salinisphaera sp.]|uniref:YggS family pyridoxal phosphate-dependent enzyme n=1 Tax=Salinisphaera sp. TaxID=1914330 RepID=UPI002D787EB4|nr:YggS family pyridoxal phosphate-dependent enzyme [Salinisphaera sp.]HET7315052.1 YggS family pyridoxal phosphate-dependent enzyme [Salinisphaera sp.]
MPQIADPARANAVDVAARLADVRRRIDDAAARFNREPGDIHLVAISKTKPAAQVAAAYDAGQTDFGENYLQDALAKIETLADRGIAWHFVGDIQSNKTRDIAACFAWAHAVDRFKIARRLSEQRPENAAPLNVCIQVNIDAQASKSGLAPEEVAGLADRMAELPGIRLRGLMAIPAFSAEFELQRRPFAALRELRDQLNQAGHALDTLSMGMSADIEAAIAEGATHVRVGTAIFGARDS